MDRTPEGAVSTLWGNPPFSAYLPQIAPISLESITRDPDLWYEDGSVIFVAGQVGFRSYIGLLEGRSTYSFAPPVGLYEDCPVIRLKDDDGKDFAQLLKSIHDWIEFYHDPSFDAVVSVIRAAARYKFHRSYRIAVERIATGYPSNLEDLQKQLPPRVVWNKLAPIAVLHLARSLHIRQLLPSALYKCAGELSISSLLAAATATDNDSLYFLTAEELKDCLETRDFLAERVKDIIYKIFVASETSPHCVNTHLCTAFMKAMVTHYYKDPERNMFGVLNDPSSWFSSVGVTTDVLCDSCMSQKTTFIQELQSEAWDDLCAMASHSDDLYFSFGIASRNVLFE